ncbi:energy transducer TonB [Sphingomonas glaciei]|uniref:Energy transducer TonB n=1 Tax=Sphingomonas glaciei TaxID=2938948 RepID=A0ABY5MYX7_9SPHN|nr:energy transducer TonB [Sphingomonas glaciei]UUR09224.1 energy transducer TonB [Sphingomonas glaciei]
MRFREPLVALALITASTEGASAPVTPTAKWVVDFADARCVASREYGASQLFLKASPLGDVVQFGIIEPGTAGPPTQVVAQVSPDAGPAFEGTALFWATTRKPPQRIRMINMSVADFQRLSGSPSLSFRIGALKRDYAIPEMPALAKVMKTCVDDLQKVWSPPADGVGSRATANLATYVTDDDYPADAIRNALSGTTAFALLIDESGRIADCTVTATSGQASLDTQTCALISRRARFVPAKDAKGKPAKDRVTARIRWQMAN